MNTACGPLIQVDVVALNVLLRSRKRPGVIGNTTTDSPPLINDAKTVQALFIRQ